MWKKSLEILSEDRKKRGRSNPAPATNVGTVLECAKEKYGFFIPEEFTEFWKIQDGLEYDGNIFYHTDKDLENEINPMDIETNNAIIASNIIWHENEEFMNYTFLGDGNIDWFVYDIEAKQYMILDKPSGDIIERYDTFDAFFTSYLSELVENM